MPLVSSFLAAPLSFGIKSLQNAGETSAAIAIVGLMIVSGGSLARNWFSEGTALLKTLI
jgi:hypothetical protein